MRLMDACGISFATSSIFSLIKKETGNYGVSKEVSQDQPKIASAQDDVALKREAGFSSRGLGITLLRFGIVGGFLLLWQFASGRWIEPFLISSPSRIFASLVTGFQSGDLLQHTWVTFTEIAIGFPLGAITGIALGYWFGRSRVLAEVFEPIIIALNGIPRTALAPLFIVWLGIGIWSKVGVVFLLTFFLNFFNTYTGMRQMDQEYVDLARLMCTVNGVSVPRVDYDGAPLTFSVTNLEELPDDALSIEIALSAADEPLAFAKGATPVFK